MSPDIVLSFLALTTWWASWALGTTLGSPGQTLWFRGDRWLAAHTQGTEWRGQASVGSHNSLWLVSWTWFLLGIAHCSMIGLHLIFSKDSYRKQRIHWVVLQELSFTTHYQPTGFCFSFTVQNFKLLKFAQERLHYLDSNRSCLPRNEWQYPYNDLLAKEMFPCLLEQKFEWLLWILTFGVLWI